LEFGNIKREVLLAGLVVGADYAALHDRPETLNGVGVNNAMSPKCLISMSPKEGLAD
jgi:hypothetical protein